MQVIRLPRNVQFMYEHALAQFELRHGFGLDPSTDPLDPWVLKAKVDGREEEILSRAAYVWRIGKKESVYSNLIRPNYKGGIYNRTRSENQYLTHWIYPYKGKFHPQMIRAILNGIGAGPGWKVADIFSGSGTTVLECQMLGIDSIGVEISPLCTLLARVKTHSWSSLTEIEKCVTELTGRDEPDPDKVNPSRWGDSAVSDFVQIARMVTYSDATRRKRDPRKYFAKNLSNMLDSVRAMMKAKEVFHLNFGKVEVLQGDCRKLGELRIQPDSLDAIITSPPYSIALDYVKNDEHALQAMGHDTLAMRDGFIGVRGDTPKERMQLYAEDMKKVFREMSCVLKPRGHAVVVIGNVTVNGAEDFTTRNVADWAKEAGLKLERQMHKIVWGLYNMIKDEKILFFRRKDDLCK